MMAGFELGQELVEIVDIPRALHLGQHDDVELVADGGNDLDDIIERPGRIERIDPGPKSGYAVVVRLTHLDEAAPRRLFDVDLADKVWNFLAQLFEVRRHEMDHALKPYRQIVQRNGRPDGKRLEELTGQFHERSRVGEQFKNAS